MPCPPRARHRPARIGPRVAGFVSCIAISAVCVGAGGVATAGDDWSLTRAASDPSLVAQRIAKLRRDPFDSKQWRALQRAMGSDGVARKIRELLARNPDELALQILDARAALAQGRAAEAAAALAALSVAGHRFEARVFELRVTALEDAGSDDQAATLLEAAANAANETSTRARLFARAYTFAQRSGRPEDALRLAERLAELQPTDPEAILRVARSARAAQAAGKTDEAFAHAIAVASTRTRDEIIVERARARLGFDDGAGAASLLWPLLADPRHGSKIARAHWFELLADAHRNAGSTAALIDRLLGFLASHDREAAAWRTLARAQDALGVDAVPSWRRAAELSPRDSEIAGALIDALHASGRSDDAIAEFERRMANGSVDAQIGFDLANRLVAAGKREQGLALAALIEGRPGNRLATLMLLLDFYNLTGDPERALGIARKLVRVAPRSTDARIALGEQLYQMNDVNAAMEQWALLPKLTRPAHRGWARHAEVMAEHGRTHEAINSMTKVLQVAPNEPKYLRLRAVLAEDERRPMRAFKLWEKVRLHATSAEDRLLRDEARTRMVELLVGGSIPKRTNTLGEFQAEAEAQLGGGQPLDDAVESGRFLAELHTRQEDYGSAVAVQERLLELQPGDPDVLADLAAAQRRAGQIAAARATLDALVQADPSRGPQILAEQSELAFEAGDAGVALQTAIRAARQDHQQTGALIRLGELHEQRGDVGAAAAAYAEALRTHAGDARARLRLAELELTRGNVKQAASLLRDVLDQGGPPELLREAGRRALDLAEATGDPMELMELAVLRTSAHPEADEPREFLLDALDRLSDTEVDRWLRDTPPASADRNDTLRRPLVASLQRGTISARLRAAEHLGRLRLPRTAVPLATMATALTPPRDATDTVRDAFERARSGALRAAGEQADPDAVDALGRVVGDPTFSLDARQVAAWGLLRVNTETATATLTPFLTTTGDPLMAALSCIALANNPRPAADAVVGAAVSRLAREGRTPSLRRSCAYAEAALTPDTQVDRLIAQLRGSDPITAAIAAWRLGAVQPPTPVVVGALLQRYIGPFGIPRDAAGAALHRLLDPDSQTAAADAAVPPAVQKTSWSMTLERWLERRIAPRYGQLRAASLAPYATALVAALAAARQGTRAEREAARGVSRPPGTLECGAPPHTDAELDGKVVPSSSGPAARTATSGQLVCLHPLVRDPIRVPDRPGPARR